MESLRAPLSTRFELASEIPQQIARWPDGNLRFGQKKMRQTRVRGQVLSLVVEHILSQTTRGTKAMLLELWAFLKANREAVAAVGAAVGALAAGAWAVFKFMAEQRKKPSAPPVTTQVNAATQTQAVHVTVGNSFSEIDLRRVFQEEVKQLAGTRGVPEEALNAVLAKLGEQGVPSSEIILRLEAAAEELIRLREDLTRKRNDRPEFSSIRAKAFTLIEQGDFDGARAALEQGRVEAREMREEVSRAEAGFLIDAARVDRLQFNLTAARDKFTEATTLDPGNRWAWLELGDIWLLTGSLEEARKSFQEGLRTANRDANERDISAAHDRIGDVQQAQGDLAAALTSFTAGLAIAERLAKADPANAGWQRDLSVSHDRIGDVQQGQGNLAAALTSYTAALAIRERLAKVDPANAGWQRDLSISHDRVGDVQQAQGNLATALTSYTDGLAIRERLGNADPANAQWQRDLSVSHERIGDVQQAQGNLAAALTSYTAGLAIRERLAKADPANAGWQRDLSISHERIGDVQRAQGNLAVALTSYTASLAIRERLAKADPTNAQWQRDLSISRDKLDKVRREQGS
jgi:tetratricopeptide (TPR) repeat protein